MVETTFNETNLGDEETGEEEEPEEEPTEQAGGSQLFTVEGIMMLLIAILFDLAGLFCVFLVWVFGIGAILGRAVSAAGMFVFTIWQATRSGSIPSKERRQQEMSGAQAVAKKMLQRFFKKHWKKLIIEALPVAGDIAPTFLMIWYSELK